MPPHRLQFLLEKVGRYPCGVGAKEPLGDKWCQRKPSQWFHRPLRNVCSILTPPYPWLRYGSALHHPNTPATSKYYKKLGTSLPHAALCPPPRAVWQLAPCPPCAGLLGFRQEAWSHLQGCGRGWNHHIQAVTHSQISFRTQWFAFQAPHNEGLSSGSGRKGETVSVPTALPTQKAEGHTSVPFTTEMLAMKPGKPSHTLDLKIIPKGKKKKN